MWKYIGWVLILQIITQTSFSVPTEGNQTLKQGTIPNTPTLNITEPPVVEQINDIKVQPGKGKKTLYQAAKHNPEPLPQNKPRFQQAQVVEPLGQKNNSRILTQSQPSKVMQGTVDGQQVHYQKTHAQQTIQLEVYKVRMVDLNYQHIKSYSFQLQDKTEFYIKVQHDVEIKGTFMMYWENSGTFSESQFESGQQVQFSIFQNHQSLLFHETCYHTMGFKFFAKKGITYSLVFRSQGYRKMISLVMENYMTQRSGVQKLSSDHVYDHEVTTQKIKNTLKTYYSVVQRNFAINQQVAYNVTLHSKRYMAYQIVEMILVILGACIQIYLIKKLLNPKSVV